MKPYTILENIRLKDGVTDYVSGEEADADLTPPLVSVASSTATQFCHTAGLGDFEAVCGFDVRGGFVIRHNSQTDELIRTNVSTGWNIRHDHRKLNQQDPVSQQFRDYFDCDNYLLDSYLHLPLPALFKSLGNTKGFHFLALRHKTGLWVEPMKENSSHSRQRIFACFYPFARILYSQNLPSARLYIKASDGHALCWRTPNRTCGLAVWKDGDDSDLGNHIRIVDGLVLAFANQMSE